MTTVPLPDVPTLRIRLVYNQNLRGEGGNRLYFSYSGSAPTAGNCATIASDVAAAWNTDIAPLTANNYALVEVDVLDIATDSGLSGQWTGSHSGSRSGTTLPVQCATNVEFGISRRYRGGKPRCFLPPGVAADLVDEGTWGTSFISTAGTGFSSFAAAINAISVGSVGTLQHVNLSYYKGFTNITNSSGRERAVPTYRTSALHDNITGYFVKAVIGSQKRRRTSTTP